jgi:hypothetical protein
MTEHDLTGAYDPPTAPQNPAEPDPAQEHPETPTGEPEGSEGLEDQGSPDPAPVDDSGQAERSEPWARDDPDGGAAG